VQRLEARHAAALRARWQALVRSQEALGVQLARAGERMLNARRERHQALGARFVRAAERTLARHGDALRRQAQALANLDPQRVLERGYTLLESQDGRALVSAAALQAGQGVVAVLHDGRADLRVDKVRMDGADPAAADKSGG
jgi:exodeoxyribonuclease VII large subunit